MKGTIYGKRLPSGTEVKKVCEPLVFAVSSCAWQPCFALTVVSPAAAAPSNWQHQYPATYRVIRSRE
jgi:hypothetical protein